MNCEWRSISAALDALVTSCVLVTARSGDAVNGCIVGSVMPIGTGADVALAFGAASLTYQLFRTDGVAAMHLLTDRHIDLARRFGVRSGHSTDKLRGISWRPGRFGAPLLDIEAAIIEIRARTWTAVDRLVLVVAEAVSAHGELSAAPVMTIENARRAGLEGSRTGERTASESTVTAQIRP